MIRFIMLAVASVASLTGAAGAEELEPYALSEAQLNALYSAVGKELRDPYSAQYEGIVAGIDGMQLVHVCGYVNAKNSVGAYTGRAPFYVSIIPYEEPKPPLVFQHVYSEKKTVISEIRSICQGHALIMD